MRHRQDLKFFDYSMPRLSSPNRFFLNKINNCIPEIWESSIALENYGYSTAYTIFHLVSLYIGIIIDTSLSVTWPHLDQRASSLDYGRLVWCHLVKWENIIHPSSFGLSLCGEETTQSYRFSLLVVCYTRWWWLCNCAGCVLLEFTSSASEVGVCLDKCGILRSCYRPFKSCYVLPGFPVMMVCFSKIESLHPSYTSDKTISRNTRLTSR